MISADIHTISSYEDLLSERKRLESLIDNQKNIIRHDFDELRAEFKREIRPATEAAGFIKKLMVPETRNQIFLKLGANVAIDLILAIAFGSSNVILRLLMPKLVKNYASHFLKRFHTSPKPGLRIQP